MTQFSVSLSSSDKLFATSACLWSKQCVHCTFGALSLTRFTIHKFKPVHAAAPSVQIPAHLSQDMELS